MRDMQRRQVRLQRQLSSARLRGRLLHCEPATVPRLRDHFNIHAALPMTIPQHKPTVVCLCGSTRFHEAWLKAAFDESLAGRITVGVAFYHCAREHGETVGITPEQKTDLDDLHLRRIDLADEILVLNVAGYIGESTARELAYAIVNRKGVRFLVPQAGEDYLRMQSHKLGVFAAEFASQATARLRKPEARGPYPCRLCHDPHFTNECPHDGGSRPVS